MFRTVTSASPLQYLQYGTRQGGANIFHICWIENMPVTSANCRCTALGLGWRGMANALTVLTPERLIEKPEIDFDSGGGCINETLENVPNQPPLSCPHLKKKISTLSQRHLRDWITTEYVFKDKVSILWWSCIFHHFLSFTEISVSGYILLTLEYLIYQELNFC